MSQGSNSTNLRAFNERVIISHIRRNGEASKADLSRLMGLTLPALTRIVDGLEAKKLIVQAGRRNVGVGQPSTLYQINDSSIYSMGIKLGRSNIEFILTNFGGKILHKHTLQYNTPSPEEMLAIIENGFETTYALLDASQKSKFMGVGIALPWFLGKWSSDSEMPENIAEKWRNFDLAEEITNRISHPIFFENDCSAAAAAEYYFGKGGEFKSFLYIYIDQFIGGGLFLNGDLERGVNSNAANLATLPVPQSKLKNSNSNEAWVPLLKRASISSLLLHLNNNGVAIAHFSELDSVIDKNRGIIQEWLEDCADSLLFAVLTSISILDLEAVIIDTELPNFLATEIIEILRRKLAKLPESNMFIPRIIQGSLNHDAIAIGGSILPLYSNFAPDRIVLLRGGIPKKVTIPSFN